MIKASLAALVLGLGGLLYWQWEARRYSHAKPHGR